MDLMLDVSFVYQIMKTPLAYMALIEQKFLEPISFGRKLSSVWKATCTQQQIGNMKYLFSTVVCATAVVNLSESKLGGNTSFSI